MSSSQLLKSSGIVKSCKTKQGQCLNCGPCFLKRIWLGVLGGTRESLSEVLVVQGRNEEINCCIMLQKHEAMPPTNFSFNVEMMPKQIRFSKIADENVDHTVQVI